MLAEVTILISDKIDFKLKSVKRDKESHYITIKRLSQPYTKLVTNQQN
jgi:hypothetical protein